MRDLNHLLGLALVALATGAIGGAVCAAFRLALIAGDDWRAAGLAQAQGAFWGGALVVLAAAALAAGAAALVRRIAPAASGSGIPHVEAVLHSELPPAPLKFIPIKFLGGMMAIGGGLALGREGPSVQMGAGIAHSMARLTRLSWEDTRALLAGGAGAGLATAFNAPAAGAIFVLEELEGRFDRRMSVVALGCSVGAITVSRAILGDALDFALPDVAAPVWAVQPLFLLFGLICGLLSVLYNRSLLRTLSLVGAIRAPVELRAAAIGAAVGAVALVAPGWIGGGEAPSQRALYGEIAPLVLPGLFLFRLALGALSYAAATPGGLFAPMLALGAMAGLGFGYLVQAIAPGLPVEPAAFAAVGMAALFAGAVRAPLTGMVLVIEMTGASQLLLPLLSGCFAAMFVAESFREAPIYQALGHRAAQDKR